jgi:hypothetical protein
MTFVNCSSMMGQSLLKSKGLRGGSLMSDSRQDTLDRVRRLIKFARGRALDDPAGLFNSSLDGNTRMAIDIPEGEPMDEDAFKALVRDAVTLNAGKAPR